MADHIAAVAAHIHRALGGNSSAEITALVGVAPTSARVLAILVQRRRAVERIPALPGDPLDIDIEHDAPAVCGLVADQASGHRPPSFDLFGVRQLRGHPASGGFFQSSSGKR